MADYNLNKRFDEVAEVGNSYIIASHTEVSLVGSDGEPYDAIIGLSPEGKRVLFSGKAVVDGFRELLNQIEGKNPYDVPKKFTLVEATARNGRLYKAIDKCSDVTL